jgi:hypothetical protein
MSSRRWGWLKHVVLEAARGEDALRHVWVDVWKDPERKSSLDVRSSQSVPETIHVSDLFVLPRGYCPYLTLSVLIWIAGCPLIRFRRYHRMHEADR